MSVYRQRAGDGVVFGRRALVVHSLPPTVQALLETRKRGMVDLNPKVKNYIAKKRSPAIDPGWTEKWTR